MTYSLCSQSDIIVLFQHEDLALTMGMQHCAQAIASGGDSSRKSLGGF